MQYIHCSELTLFLRQDVSIITLLTLVASFFFRHGGVLASASISKIELKGNDAEM